uniref:Uncharacterized protein n=1 Tax=Arundo donax TaxID=35708 RepID=A0A0A9FEC7_ARUDO
MPIISDITGLSAGSSFLQRAAISIHLVSCWYWDSSVCFGDLFHLCLHLRSTLSLLGLPLRPVTSSMIITPKLYMSAFLDVLPPFSYSGAQYPLHKKCDSLVHYGIKRFECNCRKRQYVPLTHSLLCYKTGTTSVCVFI